MAKCGKGCKSAKMKRCNRKCSGVTGCAKHGRCLSTCLKRGKK